MQEAVHEALDGNVMLLTHLGIRRCESGPCWGVWGKCGKREEEGKEWEW